MKKILITGPLGQDGTILTNLIKEKYEVIGVCSPNTSLERIHNHQNKFNIDIVSSNLINYNETKKLINNISPDIIINFAGVTNVINPFNDIENIYMQNCQIPINLLNSIVEINPDIYFFQSSSSLMYGRSNEEIINEDSKFAPLYPYGITKLYVHNMINEYRLKYNIKSCSGIFFNHESKYRGEMFVSKKVSNFVKKILSGNIEKLNLFDLNIYRDISHAEDFMRGVELVIENKINEDFIFSSGNLTNMYDFIKLFFSLNNLNFEEYIDYYDSNNYPDYYKISGDNSKLKSIGWVPKYNINELVKDMVNN
jgi:GDPmannose 4,6-dehydratase